ncbi:beta-1,4-glucuronyltransferase 1-like isoform X1 [Penaeus japonicus]|uniref:beta-1,4-glucuronyltransferase 1-like isoform X1 n=2 Tax=Penaeus japonicus TaxID=27405 RepID=UPI001C7149D3|nr:beta-1,4-glucuronyltransferase 1-like isoform X1 [Penaeus japonicus]
MEMLRARRTFLLINLVVVLLNAGLGILVNLAAFTNRSGLRERYLNMPSNVSMSPSPTEPGDEMLSAAFGLIDKTGNYTNHPFVWAGSEWAAVTSDSRVCLTTHATVDRLFWVAWQAEAWSGPMSVSIFAPGSDYAVAAAMVSYLRRCFTIVHERVSFHLVHTRARPPKTSPHYEVYRLNCAEPEEANKALMGLRDKMEPKERRYPQNLMRNLARRTCPCDYTLTIDIDMLTPPYMAENMTGFLDTTKASATCWKCAYVIPVYELQDSVAYLPNDKMDLLRLILKGQARRYHEKVYAKNQGNSKLENWEVEPINASATEYRVLYNITTYEEFWEPILVLPFTAPLFDERFVGYGFTRSSQVYELHRRGYKFQVLDRAFLTHRGFQTTTNYSTLRYAQIEINKVRYQMFKRELHAQLGLQMPTQSKGAPLRQKLTSLLSKRSQSPRSHLSIRAVPAKKKLAGVGK